VSLAKGFRIGGYTVLFPLGVGAMGEVYCARDDRLGRDIALKVLSASVAQDPHRLERFSREARVLASLSHPNIGAIYGFEDPTETTPPALVLELVEGPTIEERLCQGPLPIETALGLARQVAEALDAAHERGIVHRDLKPANVKITPTGGVKILDFGIAKVLDVAGDAASLPTATGSRVGAVIGSPAYMSPEQARGEPVDRRTDIWSFGCLLFEMLAGSRAFPGATASDAIVAVLSRDPDWGALPAATPLSVTRLLRRCLQKDARRRLRDIGDARADLEDAVGAGANISMAPAVSRRMHLFPWVLAAVLAAAWLGTSFIARRTVGAESGRAVIRTRIVLPDRLALVSSDSASPLALSPDGSTLAFVADRNGRSELYAQRLSEPEAVHLASGSGSMKPFFSPDGQRLAFVSGGTLQKVDVAGGTPIRICNFDDGFLGGAWGPDGQMVLATRNDGLFSVSSGGGTLTPIFGTVGASWPHITPDGQTLLFTFHGATAIARMPLAGGAITIVARLNREAAGEGPATLGVGGGLVQVQLVSSGYLVYGQSPGIVMAMAVDPQSLTPTGAPMPLADPVERGRNSGGVYFGVSRTGLLVYAPTGRQHRLVWVSRDGVETPLGADAGDFRFPVLSPDDSSVVVGMNDETRRAHVWLYDAVRGTRTALGPRGLEFAWHPEGQSIAAGDGGIVSISTTPGAPRGTLAESDALHALLPADTNPYPTSWSRDGRYLLFQADERQVWVLEVATKKARALIADAHHASHAVFSPDTRWIAYTSNSSGRNQVWVRSFPDLTSATQVSLDGGTNPRWSAKGNEIFYREGDAVMSVAIDTSGRPQVGRPVRLFAGHYEGAGHATTFSVTRDGQRFVLVKGDPASRLEQVAVVQHLFENLKQQTTPSVVRR
jgi:Tol biopolymer transport system component